MPSEREMCTREFLNTLIPFHRARKDYHELITVCQAIINAETPSQENEAIARLEDAVNNCEFPFKNGEA